MGKQKKLCSDGPGQAHNFLFRNSRGSHSLPVLPSVASQEEQVGAALPGSGDPGPQECWWRAILLVDQEASSPHPLGAGLPAPSSLQGGKRKQPLGLRRLTVFPFGNTIKAGPHRPLLPPPPRLFMKELKMSPMQRQSE